MRSWGQEEPVRLAYRAVRNARSAMPSPQLIRCSKQFTAGQGHKNNTPDSSYSVFLFIPTGSRRRHQPTDSWSTVSFGTTYLTASLAGGLCEPSWDSLVASSSARCRLVWLSSHQTLSVRVPKCFYVILASGAPPSCLHWYLQHWIMRRLRR
jgi:hypothetical protein